MPILRDYVLLDERGWEACPRLISVLPSTNNPPSSAPDAKEHQNSIWLHATAMSEKFSLVKAKTPLLLLLPVIQPTATLPLLRS